MTYYTEGQANLVATCPSGQSCGMVPSGEAQQGETRSNPIITHSGTELAPTADLGTHDQESDAAAAVKGFVKEAAQGKATSLFEWQPTDLVNTPGGLQTLASTWIFFLQKLSLQWHVGVNRPSFYLNFIDALRFLCFEMPAFGLARLVVPEGCLFPARLLLSVALLVRMVYVRGLRHNEDAPRYGTAAEVVRTLALGVAAPTLLSALAIAIGAATGTSWMTGLGVVLFWPIIGYLVLVHVARIQVWKTCCSKCVGRVIFVHVWHASVLSQCNRQM